MLVANKFIYVSLPRCASTSFVIACGRNNLNVEHNTERFNKYYRTVDWTLENELLADRLPHAHEVLSRLIFKFGTDYEIISVRRNRYERFISTYRHVIDEITRIGEQSIADRLKKLTVDDLLYYNTANLQTSESIENLIDEFFIKFRLNVFKDLTNKRYVRNMLKIITVPTSFYHNHNSKIIWFDFNNLGELENWVSNKLSMNFKLDKINSSRQFECKLKLDSKFIEKYDLIYTPYEILKNLKTIM